MPWRDADELMQSNGKIPSHFWRYGGVFNYVDGNYKKAKVDSAYVEMYRQIRQPLISITDTYEVE